MSEDAKNAIKAWVKIQREKYGDNWKEIVAKEMTDKSEPFVKLIVAMNRKPK